MKQKQSKKYIPIYKAANTIFVPLKMQLKIEYLYDHVTIGSTL